MQQHLDELCERAAGRRQPLFSRFLNLSEQKEAEIAARRAQAEYLLFGGAEDCERRMLGVGSEAPTPEDFPITCLKVTRRSEHYGEALEHRAVLGTIMGTGIERELVGDIVLLDGREFLTAMLASQVISNVPAALLLSGFTEQSRALILGVNIGGLGTPIASLASLISMKLYAHSEHAHTGRYLLEFTSVNLALLLLLSLVQAIL